MMKNQDLNLGFLTQTSAYNIQYKKITCRNCGKNGHIAKNCSQPIISLGILMFKIDIMENNNIPENNEEINDNNETTYTTANDNIDCFIYNSFMIESFNNYQQKINTEKKIDLDVDAKITNNDDCNFVSNKNISEIDKYIIKEIRNKQGIVKNFIYTNNKNNYERKKKYTLKMDLLMIKIDPTTESIAKFIYYQNKIKFLLVSRKRSIGLMELMRGKYDVNDVNHLISLFQQMTSREYQLLKNQGIKVLIQEFIKESNYENEKNQKKDIYDIKNFDKSIEKFEKLKSSRINLDFYIHNVKPQWDYPEWGFPKGRRNIIEKNVECAKREFTEETGINSEQYKILNKLKPLTEIFYGTNKIKYKHIYYIGYLSNNQNIMFNNHSSEIGEIGWFTYSKAIDMIRPYHIERKNILTLMYIYLLNHLIN